MQPKLIISFDALSEPNFLAKAELINDSLGSNANFPLPWPTKVPTLAELDAAFTTYQTNYNDAEGGDAGSIAVRNAARDALTVILKKIAPYLELVADGSVPILLTTGYDLRQDAVRSTRVNPLPAPAGFNVVRGTMSGVLVASASALAGAGSYEAQICTGDPTVEANWTDAGTFMHCSHIELKGLTPGKMVSVRLRGIGSHGPGAWAPAFSLMVV